MRGLEQTFWTTGLKTTDDPTSKIWDFLRAQDDLYIIHLTRENILETITSRKIADYTDIWSLQSPKKQNPEKPLQVRFTKEEAEEKFIQTREWEKKGEEWFNHHNVLHITYEDLTQYRSETFGKVADFLGVARQDVSTSLKKQRKKALSDTIEGYKELKQSFINTEWEEFFVD
ncbi:Stf0 family sulfotransferase [Chromohalobacter sp. 48-RD10]|uniref:Stf0 family sulfotransferase n=1 Tax=Chromohalobacter sp. 48-RD10 TaxID=2994063 RepID=UPI0024684EF3|nr:Stf0 family sulfotransferase [Chromohalobacter sp. 48-RD10]